MPRQAIPRPYLRKPTARAAERWWSCIPLPEREWNIAITSGTGGLPVGVLADFVDESFTLLLGETYGKLRLGVWKEHFDIIEETVEVLGVERRFYIGLESYWFEWAQWRFDYPAVDTYNCETRLYLP